MSDTQTEVARMQAEDSWPMWPILPVKRSAKASDGQSFGPVVGFLHSNVPNTVFIGNIYGIPNGTPLRDLPREEFDSLEALAQAGWRVD